MHDKSSSFNTFAPIDNDSSSVSGSGPGALCLFGGTVSCLIFILKDVDSGSLAEIDGALTVLLGSMSKIDNGESTFSEYRK